MLASPGLLRIFPSLSLGCAINNVCSLPSTGIHPSLILLFFFFAWGPNGVVAHLAVAVAATAARLVLLVVVVVGRRRRPPLLCGGGLLALRLSFARSWPNRLSDSASI